MGSIFFFLEMRKLQAPQLIDLVLLLHRSKGHVVVRLEASSCRAVLCQFGDDHHAQ